MNFAFLNSCRHLHLLSLGLLLALAHPARAAVTNVAWYRLGENDPGAASGMVVANTTTDLVGGNHLKRVGSPLYANAISVGASNRVGSSLAVSFNGSNQYLSNAVVSTVVNNFGIEAWVKPNTTNAGVYFIAFNGLIGSDGWGIFQDGDRYFGAFGGASQIVGGTPSPGRWDHVALVRANGTNTFYLNGIVAGTNTFVPNAPTGGFGIGAYLEFPGQPTGGFFNGTIDEVRVFTFAAGQFTTNDLLLNLHRVATFPATSVNPPNASLNGSANAAGLPTSAWFEWGTTTNYGNVTPPQTFGSGSTNFSQVLSGLTADITYNFRAVASNSLGVVQGTNQSFSAPRFADIGAGLPGVSYSSAAWGDYDNDGRLDILMAGSTGPFAQTNLISQIWRNNGSGFSNINAGLPGVTVGAAAWGDYNNDGRLDILMTGPVRATPAGGLLNFISHVLQNSNGSFIITATNVRPLYLGSVAWGDYDNDGRSDILLTGGEVSQVWRNTGSGFTNINAGLPGLIRSSAAWGDYDNDGRLDILLTGEINTSFRVSQIWRNTGNGFTNINAALPAVTRSSAAWGDYDNDGRLDILLSGLAIGNVPITQILRNTGTGFTNINAGLPGVLNGSVAWGDVDNDGRPDVLLTGAFTNESQAGFISQVWRNTVTGFTNLNLNLPGVGFSSVALGDYDNDGRLDLFLTGATSVDANELTTASISQIWRNNLPLINTPPTAPTGLAATFAGNLVTLNWNASSDAQTIASGLNYNARVGTTPGGSDVVAAMTLTNGLRLLPALGNAQSGTSVLFRGQYGLTYYWSVQAVDPGFAGSPFAADQQIFIPPLLVQPLRLGNGVFQFWFTNFSSDTYGVLGTTNLSLPVASWQFLGLPAFQGSGIYQFNDSLAPTYSQRYYLLRKE